MTFLLPNTLTSDVEALLQQACFAGGYDQTPMPTQLVIDDGRIVVSRSLNESGYLLIPWRIDPFGTFVTTTATLRERQEPYRLLVELARGKLNQVRTQTALWQDLGLRTPPEIDQHLADATRLFGKAVLNQNTTTTSITTSPTEADAVATRVLEWSYNLADQITRLYINHNFTMRLREVGPLSARLAARFVTPPNTEYTRTFNAAQVGFRWRDVEPSESRYEWASLDLAVANAREAGLPITAGPVIDITPGMLPDWATGWEGDLPTLAAFMCDFLETVIGRYKPDIRRWIICAGFNHADGLGLNDDDRLRLAARLFDAAAQLDPELDLILSISQPWGDYLVNDDQTISPFAFADDLIRAGLRISAVELELRPGSLPRGSLPRDLLDTARLLGHFGGQSGLGLPLEVVLSCPASRSEGAVAALPGQRIWEHGWRGGPTPEDQAAWGAAVASLSLSEPYVRAVTWDHWSDADWHITPTGGLLDSSGRTNPLLDQLRKLRATYLASPSSL